MAEITAKMVMELREQTGAAMMLCKEALKETDGNFDEAKVYIRKKLGKKLEGATDRSAGEGVVAFAVNGTTGALIELNAETDFVARNDEFKALAKELAEHVATSSATTMDAILEEKSATNPGATVRERIDEVYAKLRERIIFRRFERFASDANGALAGYVHAPAGDKIGVLVELGTASAEQAASDAIKGLGRELAMQIAASRPKYLTRDEVPANIVETERDIAATQARNEGRPEAALEKIVEGRLNKYFEETVLTDQVYLRDPKKKVTQVVKEAGDGIAIRRFLRYVVGEKLESAE